VAYLFCGFLEGIGLPSDLSGQLSEHAFDTLLDIVHTRLHATYQPFELW
jgi:hypothetical protein